MTDSIKPVQPFVYVQCRFEGVQLTEEQSEIPAEGSYFCAQSLNDALRVSMGIKKEALRARLHNGVLRLVETSVCKVELPEDCISLQPDKPIAKNSVTSALPKQTASDVALPSYARDPTWNDQYRESRWSAQFARLVKFKNSHGHFQVTQRGTDDRQDVSIYVFQELTIRIPRSLYTWMNRMKTLYQEGQLAQDKIDMLNGIGFSWSKSRKSTRRAGRKMSQVR